MIIGNGLLASAFSEEMLAASGAVVFASGVSNSGESRPEPFLRERAMLEPVLASVKGRPLVYFSTCSVMDEDRAGTHYVQHKLAMEALVRSAERHLILRLPQVVGFTDNPNTLTNFLARSIRSGESFQIWKGALRCLIDVEHVALATRSLLDRTTAPGTTADLAPPWTTTMSDLVGMMEQALGRNASYSVIDRGGGATPDPSLMRSVADAAGIDLSPGYTQRLINRYYA